MREYNNQIYNCDFMDIINDFPDNIFDLLILDFPYNLKKDFPNDNMKPKEFRRKLREWVKAIVPKLKENGSLYAFMGYDYNDYLRLLLSKYLIFKREIIWHYKDGGNPRNMKNYLSEFDKILFFVKSKEYVFKNLRLRSSKYTIERWKQSADSLGFVKWKQLSKDQKRKVKSKEHYEKNPFNIYRGKQIGNVIIIPKVNNLAKEREIHPTQKPESLIEIFVKVSSNEGDLVGDFFLGSGTTCAVAKKLKRNYFGTELKKEYFEIAQKRLNDVNVYKDISNYLDKKEKTILDY